MTIKYYVINDLHQQPQDKINHTLLCGGHSLSSSSPPDFSEVRVARPLVFCVVFCRSLFVLCTFSFYFFWPLYYLSFHLLLLAIVLSVLPFTAFGHCIICPSIYCFWPLYYLSFHLLLLNTPCYLKTFLTFTNKITAYQSPSSPDNSISSKYISKHNNETEI